MTSTICRTLPRVRELKLDEVGELCEAVAVAPFPGCVN